ncbi:hypothetical protein A9Q74_09860 [Colwellia sp. 39_35_sub15_T18]|nr:hypothetical protein A9Q74_09860 [Colwellia sp. 39_35_sub15_T18]
MSNVDELVFRHKKDAIKLFFKILAAISLIMKLVFLMFNRKIRLLNGGREVHQIWLTSVLKSYKNLRRLFCLPSELQITLLFLFHYLLSLVETLLRIKPKS